jgi:hypothetical protein
MRGIISFCRRPGTWPPARATWDRQWRTLFDWLERHGVPYDEIWFGKPQADVYVDDNAVRFESWAAIAGDGSSLPTSQENRVKGIR